MNQEEDLCKGDCKPINMLDELVSIIVSVFNVEHYLPMCLESITRQTYVNLEIILIDDGSKDASGAICDVFAAKDPRARVIHQENQGIWAVRNRGQAEAKGEYLLFIDGDDYFHKDFISLLYKAINKSGHRYPLSICRYKKASDDGENMTSDINPTMIEMNRAQLIEQFFSSDQCTYAANWNKLYRKDSIERPFQRAYLRSQDIDSNIHAYLTTIDQAVLVDNILYIWRIHPGQATRAENNPILQDRCRSLIFYDNHIRLSRDMKSYDHYLLMALYRRLACWMDSSAKTDERKQALCIIKEIKRKTAFDFLFCKHEPIVYKIGLLLLLDFPFSGKLLSSFKRTFITPLDTVK